VERLERLWAALHYYPGTEEFGQLFQNMEQSVLHLPQNHFPKEIKFD